MSLSAHSPNTSPRSNLSCTKTHACRWSKCVKCNMGSAHGTGTNLVHNSSCSSYSMTCVQTTVRDSLYTAPTFAKQNCVACAVKCLLYSRSQYQVRAAVCFCITGRVDLGMRVGLSTSLAAGMIVHRLFVSPRR